MQSDRVPRLLLAGAALVLLGYLGTELFLLGRLGFPLDDSWIHLQFARHLAAGHGLVYTGAERVTGSTAPLWTAILAAVLLFPGSALVWVKLAGAALSVAGVALTWRLARELGMGRGLAGLAAAWAITCYWLAWSALSGMEVPLFIALSLAGMVLAIREHRDPSRLPLALPVLAVAALVRPEGYLLLGLALVDLAANPGRRPRALLEGAGIAALCVLPTWLVYAWIGGSPLPTTFGAKAGAVRGLPDLQYLYLVIGVLFRPLPWATLLAGGGLVRLWERRGTPRDRGLLPALWLVALPVAYAILAPQGKHLLLGNFGRYFFPLLPVVAILGAAALEGVWQKLESRRSLRAILIAFLLAPSVATLLQGAARYAQNVANVEDSDVAMALWLRDRLPPQAVLAVQDIGALGFLLPQRLVDVSGIVSPRVQILMREATTPEDPYGTAGMRRFLEESRPDYLVAYPAWYPALVADSSFRPIHRVRIDGNITMAGDELILYATPWTRYPLGEPAAAGSSTR